MLDATRLAYILMRSPRGCCTREMWPAATRWYPCDCLNINVRGDMAATWEILEFIQSAAVLDFRLEISQIFYYAVNRHRYFWPIQWVPLTPSLSPLRAIRNPKSRCAELFLVPHHNFTDLAVSARRGCRQPPPAGALAVASSAAEIQNRRKIRKFKNSKCSAEAPGLATAQNRVQGTESKVQGVSRGAGIFKMSKAAFVRIKCEIGRFL